MKILKFKLWGETAFFKKPDVNTYLYFTYSSIHKVALMGLFGAILGYKGYNQMEKDDVYPEFYEKLNSIKVAIEPKEGSRGNVNKKIQVFNNSVGYASEEQGGNLIVKEQWLEYPCWNIYVLIDSDETQKLLEYITGFKSVFIPYLGKNDHIANITEIEVYDVDNVSDDIEEINSLVPKKYFNFSDDIDEIEGDLYKYQEKLPIGLNEVTNMYEFETFIYTNMLVDEFEGIDIYTINNKNIGFF